MKIDLQETWSFLENVAINAGEFLKESFLTQDFELIPKRDKTPLSTADLLSEKFIIEQLTLKYPDINIVSEERSIEENESNISSCFFVIDPLDGTKNFINRIPFFNISIALVIDNQPSIGVVYDVMHSNLYSAAKNKGAFLNHKKIVTKKYIENALLDININLTKFNPDSVSQLYREVLPISKTIRHFGNAVLETCFISDGIFDALLNQYLELWDIAACTLILEEANGFCTNLNGEELDYTSLKKQSLLASSNKILHDKLQKTAHNTLYK